MKKSLGNISHPERSKRILKSRPPELDQLIKLPKLIIFYPSRNEWLADEIFTDEYSDESSEDLFDEDNIFFKNSASLTGQFRIIQCVSNCHWLFHILNNVALGSELWMWYAKLYIKLYREEKRKISNKFVREMLKIIF